MEECAQKEFDKADTVRDARKATDSYPVPGRRVLNPRNADDLFVVGDREITSRTALAE